MCGFSHRLELPLMGTALQSPAAPRASSYYKTTLGIVSAYLLRTNSHHF